jgi:uncharacterized membrane protein YeaQ/YmgE (transglycosylase-associated protein family)
VNLLTALIAQSDPDRGMLMSVVTWLIVGLIAGFLASKIVNKRGEAIMLDIVLGLVGSVVGGFIIRLLGIGGTNSFIMTIVVATLGAVLVLIIYHKVLRARA